MKIIDRRCSNVPTVFFCPLYGHFCYLCGMFGRIVTYVIVGLLLVSCNPGVFIEPLDVARAEYDVRFYGGTVEIDVTHGDWELDRVAYDNIDLGFVEDADGVLWHEDNFIHMHISRPQPSKLWVTIDDSVNPEAGLIEIFIKNDYESEVVTINVSPCGGYAFSHIEYGDVQMLTPSDAYEEGWRKSVKNSTSSPLSQTFDVFEGGVSRTVFFPAATVVSADMPYAAWYDTLMQYLDGESFEVPVPDALPVDGSLTFSGEEVEFGYSAMEIPMPELDEQAKLTLAPGVNEVRMMWGYMEHKVPYVLTITHSGGGRDLTLCGEFTSKAYNGKWRAEL